LYKTLHKNKNTIVNTRSLTFCKHRKIGNSHRIINNLKEYYIKEFSKHENNDKISVKGVQGNDRRKKKEKLIGEEKRKKKTIYKSSMKIGNREILGLIILIILSFAYIAFNEVNVISTQREGSISSTIKKPEVKKGNILVFKDCVRTFVSHSEKQGIYPNRAELEIINQGCED